MSANNTSTVVGNLTRDPELRFLNSGNAVVKFSLAVNHRWMNNQTKEWEEKANFFDCTAWGKLAENIADTFNKGDRVIVMGRLDLQQWTTDDNQKRSKVEIVVEAAGPDLLWVTADVKANPRGESSSGGRSSGGRTSARRRTEPEPEYDENEEPF